MPNYRAAIIVGASSGIGAELVDILAKQGCMVAAVARRKERLDVMAANHPGKVFAFEHDVHDTAAVPALFQEITGKLGGIDLLVYASGVMPTVGYEEFNFAKDREMVEVNVIGAIAWLNEAANRMQQTHHGSIVAIGSRAGERGLGSMPVYGMTKAAIAAYMEALRNRLSRFGVRVVTVKPGPTATEMTANSNIKGMMPSRTAAEKILKLSAKNGEHFLKFSDRIVGFVIRNFPGPILRKPKL